MQYEIRPGSVEDIPQAIPLIEEFVEVSLVEYGFQISSVYALEAFKKFVAFSLVLIVENKIVGLIAGTLLHHPLTGEKIFQEQVWYVSKRYRRYGLALLDALEQKLLEVGADKLIMGYMANSMSEKLHKLYESIGFRFMEAHFIKEIKNESDRTETLKAAS